jgi:hypothetical protein
MAFGRTVLLLDPPDHTRLRRLMLAAFTPRAVEALRPVIQRLVDDMLDAVAPSGRMDVIADLAYPLPTTVIAITLGVPHADHDRFKAWSVDVATLLDGDPRRPERTLQAYRGMTALLDYLERLVAARRGAPRDDLLQALIDASDGEDSLTAAEVVANSAFLLAAGHETTTKLIGNGLLALLRHPAQLAQLQADPALLATAVEELLRYDSPVQITARTTTEALELGGRSLPAGEMVMLYLAAANHDPAHFVRPDALDITRQENRHLAFSHGPHFCLGAALARLEGQITLGTLLRRWPRPRLAADTVTWRDNINLRGLAALSITLA